ASLVAGAGVRWSDRETTGEAADRRGRGVGVGGRFRAGPQLRPDRRRSRCEVRLAGGETRPGGRRRRTAPTAQSAAVPVGHGGGVDGKPVHRGNRARARPGEPAGGDAGCRFRRPKARPYRLGMEVALTGSPFTAEASHAHGLVIRLVEPGQALAQARELAAQIAANGPLAVRATKQIVSSTLRWTDAGAFADQAKVVEPVFKSADAQEGARAFAEKRAPVWRGE